MEDYISHYLHKLPDSTQLTLNICTTENSKETGSLFKSIPPSSVSCRRQLILLSQTHPTTKKDVVIFGLTAYEYTIDNPLITSESPEYDYPLPRYLIFIDRIDSTGYSTIPSASSPHISASRAVVLGYLSYAFTIYEKSKTQLHVYAKVSEQYLFPESGKNGSKYAIADRELIAWWKKTLSLLPPLPFTPVPSRSETSTSSNSSLKGFYLIPSHTLVSSSRLLSSSTSDNSSIQWSYGVPYPSTAKASAALPLLPDDDKGRYLTETKSKLFDDTNNVTVGEFFEVIGEIKARSGELSCWFVVVSEPINEGTIVKETEPVTAEDNGLKIEDFISLMNQLMSLDFATLKTAVDSSIKINESLKAINVPDCHISISNSVLPKPHDKSHEVGEQQPKPVAAVNNLSGLIKKRKTKPTDGEAGQVNDLSAMIKRKR
ncbi:histone acetylation protein-domain-containing protein [Paraphysoderma sedebokerense]|nr:histone acetylation protein-domain-containing protein [Paraphysoderma sedebokerense]